MIANPAYLYRRLVWRRELARFLRWSPDRSCRCRSCRRDRYYITRSGE
jgi:hypothetical protein